VLARTGETPRDRTARWLDIGETNGEEEKKDEPEEVLPGDVSKCEEGCREQHRSGQRGWGISQEGAGVVRVLVMADGKEFDAEGIFAVRTDVQGVPQGEGIEDCEGCCESEEEKQKPADADLTGS
jgi:hypothetical protein